MTAIDARRVGRFLAGEAPESSIELKISIKSRIDMGGYRRNDHMTRDRTRAM